MKSIIIGCDHIGYELKAAIKSHLEGMGLEVVDVGVYDTNPADYPDIALAVAERVAAGEFERGILVCGTGIGMAIAANKVPGIRAAQCHDVYSAERARKSNDAQIMTMGSLVIGPELAKRLVDVWLESEFQGGRSLCKVEKLNKIDMKYRKRLHGLEGVGECG